MNTPAPPRSSCLNSPSLRAPAATPCTPACTPSPAPTWAAAGACACRRKHRVGERSRGMHAGKGGGCVARERRRVRARVAGGVEGVAGVGVGEGGGGGGWAAGRAQHSSTWLGKPSSTSAHGHAPQLTSSAFVLHLPHALRPLMPSPHAPLSHHSPHSLSPLTLPTHSAHSLSPLVIPTHSPHSLSPLTLPTHSPHSLSPLTLPTHSPHSLSPLTLPTHSPHSLSPLTLPTHACCTGERDTESSGRVVGCVWERLTGKRSGAVMSGAVVARMASEARCPHAHQP
ncbi:unnamed protein product [Closterium sp. Naga37s-1]|nr:unnamed protein product [Closterium sp. Naga37s-1]